MKEDLTVGKDFAIRVQELDTSFKGKLTRNVELAAQRLGYAKTRRAPGHRDGALLHGSQCYRYQRQPRDRPACHILSQSQRIDWLTAEIEPVLEGRFGPVTAEYSRTMRALTTDDQLVTRPYDNFGFDRRATV